MLAGTSSGPSLSEQRMEGRVPPAPATCACARCAAEDTSGGTQTRLSCPASTATHETDTHENRHRGGIFLEKRRGGDWNFWATYPQSFWAPLTIGWRDSPASRGGYGSRTVRAVLPKVRASLLLGAEGAIRAAWLVVSFTSCSKWIIGSMTDVFNRRPRRRPMLEQAL